MADTPKKLRNSSETALKPCPFCGCEVIPERTCESVNVNGYAFRFECSLCGYVAIVHNCEFRLDELPNYCPNCGAKVVEE